jgi:replicative DNA helicase
MKPLEDNGVPTGLKFLDRAWRGGVRPGELAVLLASTNLGKTQALCFFAGVAYRANLQVLYFTFELNPKEILRRITAGLLARPSGSIDIEETGQLLAQIRLNRGITEADIEIRTGSLKVSDVILDIEEMEQDGRKPDVVLLDSADDLESRQKYQTLYMQQGEIYNDLRKHVALGLEISVWTSTQATKEAIDKAKISLKHIGDSYWKARRAHFVLGLSQSESDRADPFGSSMTMRVLKDSQHGSPGVWQSVRPKFGPGFEGKGYPGFEEIENGTDG